ncbi:MAG: CDP-alcohol phosphatidyltransferase family protein [Miltoncostaeaceae bacterium]
MERSDDGARHGRLRWLPNALTILRLLALPVLWRTLGRGRGPSRWAALLFAATGITDFADGAMARRLGAQTRFGRVADPLADRLLVAVGLIGLIRRRRLSPVGPLVLLARDAASVLGFLALWRRGVNVRVDTAGKASSALSMAATALALGWRARWIDRLFAASVIASLVTFGRYVVTLRGQARHSSLPGPVRSDSQRELEGGETTPSRDQEP